jgi:predicted MFS family arabinose efflux permease
MGYSRSEAGVVMGLFGLGAVAGAYLSGKLTDRIGFYPVQVFTLIGGGVLFFVLERMQSYLLICGSTFLLSFVNEAFRPANSTAIAYYSKPENRTRSYSLNRLSINLGWAIGSAMGGWMASIDYRWLFWLDGSTNILAGILLWVWLKPVGKSGKEVSEKSDEVKASVYKDKIYLLFIGLTFVFASCFFQLFTNLPAYYRNEVGFSERFIGLLGAINGLLITFFEMLLVFKLEKRWSHTYMIGRGVFLCGMAYLLVFLFSMQAPLAIAMIILVTFGEIFSMPFMNSFWITRSSSHNRGQYAALYTMSWATAQTVAPVTAAFIAEMFGFPFLWGSVSVLMLLAAGGFGYLHSRWFSHSKG